MFESLVIQDRFSNFLNSATKLLPEKFQDLIFSKSRDQHPDSGLTPEQIVKKHGYNLESYKIVSSDGYILTVFRITGSKKCPPCPGKKVIWLQHGLLGSWADWILNTTDKSLAFILADKGFDVWLGNARGTKYTSHFWLHPKNPDFWKFSWDEMGMIDVPIMIDKALEVSGQKNLSWIGHSMGCAMFFVALSLNPEYNNKINGMIALAPATYVSNMTSPIYYLTPFATKIESLVGPEFLPRGPLNIYEILGKYIGVAHIEIQKSVWGILYSVMGFNFEQMNVKQLPIILQHYPVCASSRSIVHYTKLARSKKFSAYDFGSKTENLKAYGAEEPPNYDLSKVTCPIALFYSENDFLVNAKDVERLASELPHVITKSKSKTKYFNHSDFLWAKNCDILLYKDVLKVLEDL